MNETNGSKRRGTRRALASLSLLIAVGVVTATGAIAFLRPFSLTVTSLHVVFGLCLVIAAIWHIGHNIPQLKRYLKTQSAVVCATAATVLAAAVFLQAPPIRTFMGWSADADRSPVSWLDREGRLRLRYAASEDCLLVLDVQKGPTYPVTAPCMAIWLENESAYHIHTLHAPEREDGARRLPYWRDKRAKWQKAREESEAASSEDTDAVSGATPNASFDPADYILADDQRYTVLLEISATRDDATEHASLVYSVEIDNSEPVRFQVLSRLGIPEPSPADDAWVIGYDVSRLGEDALNRIDSALVTLDRRDDAKP